MIVGVLSSSHFRATAVLPRSSTPTPFPLSGIHCVICRGSGHKKAVAEQTAAHTAQGTQKTPTVKNRILFSIMKF